MEFIIPTSRVFIFIPGRPIEKLGAHLEAVAGRSPRNQFSCPPWFSAPSLQQQLWRQTRYINIYKWETGGGTGNSAMAEFGRKPNGTCESMFFLCPFGGICMDIWRAICSFEGWVQTSHPRASNDDPNPTQQYCWSFKMMFSTTTWSCYLEPQNVQNNWVL